MKPLGLPLRSLLQELDDSIPPREEPENPKVNEKENSFDSPRRESSLPASPLRSPIRAPEKTIHSENPVKSPGRNGEIVAKHLKSLLEDGGSPIGYTERSPEKPAVSNRMAEAMGGGKGKIMRVESGVVRRSMLRRAEIGLRVSEVALCLVSFSLMVADKTSGWAGDYFDRYQEYRYCFSVNVIAFAYSTFQLFSHFHYMIWKRHIISRPLGGSFDFLLDQVLAYLLMSASSSAATRNDDWVSMFGSDRFTDMLIGSIATSFIAFLAFAISSIISAYKLFSLNP